MRGTNLWSEPYLMSLLVSDSGIAANTGRWDITDNKDLPQDEKHAEPPK